MSPAEVLVVIGTIIASGTSTKVVKSVVDTVRGRATKGPQAEARKTEIARIASSRSDDDSTVTQLINALEGTRNAVVVAGDLAVVKDSGKGGPHIVVKHLSPDQRNEIANHHAPTNDAAAFETWLG